MKNTIKIIVCLVLFIIFSSNVSATSTKNKIFKELAITTTQIERDYGTKGIKYNKALEKYFIEIRYYKQKNKLKELEAKLIPVLIKYNEKSYLTLYEKRLFNLYKNIFYRSKILSMYYIK